MGQIDRVDTDQVDTIEIDQADRADVIVADITRVVCRHFARKGHCLYGDQCKFSHVVDVGSAGKAGNGSQTPTSTQVRRAPCGRKKVNNAGRCCVLRRFVYDNYFTSRGGGDAPSLTNLTVLDVAGGKGELAFKFLNFSKEIKHAIVIDPRPLEVKKFIRKTHQGFFTRSDHVLHPHNNKSRSTTSNDIASVAPLIPEHIPLLFRPELFVPLGTRFENGKYGLHGVVEEQLEENLRLSRAWDWKTHDKHHDNGEHEQEDKIDDEHQADAQTTSSVSGSSLTLGDDVMNFDHYRKLVAECDFIVGMHPDQGAEWIVEAAISQRKPFFVVPCCTYAKEFTWRKLSFVASETDDVCGNIDEDNINRKDKPQRTLKKLVTTYADLLDWLQQKAPGIRRDKLDFEGKNYVIWKVDYSDMM